MKRRNDIAVLVVIYYVLTTFINPFSATERSVQRR